MVNQSSETIWIYLARRDKKTIRLLTTLGTGQCLPTRLSNLGDLGISSESQAELSKIIHENRFEWEPWMESADSYRTLKRNLLYRGFGHLPLNNKLEIFPLEKVNPQKVIGSPTQKSMLRRGKG